MKLQDCLLRFERGVAAVASIFRDLESLQAAVMMELEVESDVWSWHFGVIEAALFNVRYRSLFRTSARRPLMSPNDPKRTNLVLRSQQERPS